MERPASPGPPRLVKRKNAPETHATNSILPVGTSGQSRPAPSHLSQPTRSQFSTKSAPYNIIKKEPTPAPISQSTSASSWEPPIKQERAFSYAILSNSNQSSRTPVDRHPAINQVSVDQIRPVKKRSRSPGASQVLANIPNVEHDKKRAKADSSGHTAPPLAHQTQSLQPQNNTQAHNKSNKKNRHRGQTNRQKREKYKKKIKHKNKNPVKNVQKQRQSKPLNPRSSKVRDIAGSSRMPGREMETTSKKLQAAGYVFVQSGSIYITRNCKRLTLESGRTVWKVDHPKGNGIQVPKDVYDTVLENEKATRDQRKAVIDKLDKKEKDEARECLLVLFPNLPPGEDDVILGRAWERSSGRVGRTSKLNLQQKVRKAVVAHVRHAHTDYETRIREEFIKNGRQRVADNIVQSTRNQMWGQVNAVVNSWRPQPQGNKGGKGKKKEKEKGWTGEENQSRRERNEKREMRADEEKMEGQGMHTRSYAKGKRGMRKGEGFASGVRGQKLGEIENGEHTLGGRQQMSGEDYNGKGKAQPVEIIVIDSDSGDDATTAVSRKEITLNSEEGVEEEGEGEEEISTVNINSDSGGERAEDWDIGEDDDFFYAEELDDEDYIMDTDNEYPTKTYHTRYKTQLMYGDMSDEDEGEIMDDEGEITEDDKES